MKKSFKSFLGLFLVAMGVFIVSTSFFSNEADAATITDDYGRDLTRNSLITEGGLNRVNATMTNPCGGQVYTKEVTVSLYGSPCTLPSQLNYTDWVCGFVIPFQTKLILKGIYGCGANTYGVYTGVPLSYTR